MTSLTPGASKTEMEISDLIDQNFVDGVLMRCIRSLPAYSQFPYLTENIVKIVNRDSTILMNHFIRTIKQTLKDMSSVEKPPLVVFYQVLDAVRIRFCCLDYSCGTFVSFIVVCCIYTRYAIMKNIIPNLLTVRNCFLSYLRFKRRESKFNDDYYFELNDWASVRVIYFVSTRNSIGFSVPAIPNDTKENLTEKLNSVPNTNDNISGNNSNVMPTAKKIDAAKNIQ